MNKFKVKDRVKLIVNYGSDDYLKKGTEGEVTDNSASTMYPYRVRFKDMTTSILCAEEELELVKANVNIPYIDNVIAHLENEAKQLEIGAAYGGSWGDGGASEIRKAIYYYKCGMNGTIPVKWVPLHDHFVKVGIDPDYQKYMELKDKYGD